MALAEALASVRTNGVGSEAFKTNGSVAVRPNEDLLIQEGGLSSDHKGSIITRLVELGIIEEDAELPFAEEPHPHFGSQGKYYLEFTAGEYEVYAYTLGPRKLTSIHDHPEGITERIEVIAGEASIQISDDVYNFKNAVIGSDVRHRCSTKGKPALILAITHNPNNVSKEDLHRRTFDGWEKDWRKDKKRGIDTPKAVVDLQEAA